jgi:ribonuclease T2
VTRIRERLWAVLLGTATFSWATFGLAASTPGKFDYYLLALSWSPSFCAGEGRARKSPQCSGTRPYAFVLHGLWPQYETGWPNDCTLAKKPWVPSKLISSMLDIMPARGLVIHQYKKHGTCSGLEPEDYFQAARTAFDNIKIPARYLRPQKPVIVSPREIENDFIKTNQNLTADMISISCGRNKRLREVRICLSKDLELRSCGANETQQKLCRLDKIVMPPVRGR